MSTNFIDSHSFDNAKKQLKEFSEKIPANVDLKPVATNSGPFDLFDHDVTGAELNELTAEIQKHLITINGLIINSIKEFGQVYAALEALDKDYIQAIILAVKSAEEASNQAKKAAEDAKINTKDIFNIIKVQEKTLEVLTQFKVKIDANQHLLDIDEIWSDGQKLKNNIQSANDSIKRIEKKLNELQISQDKNINQLKRKIKISFMFFACLTGIPLAGIILNMLGLI